MSTSRDEKDKTESAYRVALEARNLEIELFWRRSLFFWGFISVAFAGYAALRPGSRGLALVVACFGMVCSFAWVLVNRGSKYWQEAWEAQVAQLEDAVTGPLFKLEYKPEASPLVGGKRFSVSRVTIALSIYTFLVWFGVVLWELVGLISPLDPLYILPAFIVFPFAYLLVLHAQKGQEGRGPP